MTMEWIDIVKGCPMPEPGEDVIITIWSDDSYGKGTDIGYYVDVATYCNDGSGYLDTDIPGCGFTTVNDWDEGQPIKVVAWMRMPRPRIVLKDHLDLMEAIDKIQSEKENKNAENRERGPAFP